MRAGWAGFGLVVAAGLVLGAAGAVGPVEAAGPHTGKGVVLSVDARAGRLSMTEEPRGTHVLTLTAETRVFDAEGVAMTPAALQPGDLVREECDANGPGQGVARQIRVLRPAWLETASPEQ